MAKKIVKKLISILILLILILGIGSWGYVYIASANMTRDIDAPNTKASCWMGDIDDSVSLKDITLPGTHDSATCYVQVPYLAKCQLIPIDKQLQCGFRYLDIRLCVKDNKLVFKHGPANCKVSIAPWSKNLELSDVLDMCYSFLDSNPTETIIFNVKCEDKDQDIAQFQNMLDEYIAQRPDMWLCDNHIPRLSQARGKIVLARRYDDVVSSGSKSGLPIIWQDQKGEADKAFESGINIDSSTKLFVQDHFEIETPDKYQVFKDTLKATSTDKDALFINFLSTKGPHIYGCPYRYASKLNPEFMKSNLSETQNNGWIILDFGSFDEAEKIFETNF